MGTDAGVLEALASQALELARIAPAGWDGVLLVHCEDDVVEEAAHIDELVKVLVSIVAVAAARRLEHRDVASLDLLRPIRVVL